LTPPRVYIKFGYINRRYVTSAYTISRPSASRQGISPDVRRLICHMGDQQGFGGPIDLHDLAHPVRCEGFDRLRPVRVCLNSA